MPTFPVTEGYAKSVLILHVPWKNTFNEPGKPRNYIEEFQLFLDSPNCPLSVRVGYGRAKARYQQNKRFVEPTGRTETTNYKSFSTTNDESIREIVSLASTLGLTCVPDIGEENEYFCGDDKTDWSQQNYKVRVEIQPIYFSIFIGGLTSLQLHCSTSDASVWLEQTIAQFDMEEDNSEELKIPKRLNQEHKYEEYSIDACSKDQKKAMAYILQHLKTWNKLAKTPELQETFKPLRMTLSGVAGSGKSTLINTLVTAIRKITGKTNSVYVVGPTGSAAFNAGGVTCHRLFNINGTPKNFELSGQTLRTLLSKLESTVALIVDERSMVSSLLLGTMEAYCRQAAFKGTKCHLRWGGLPIVILVGDDHQLPPIQEGAFHC
jgi:hypothetical protein